MRRAGEGTPGSAASCSIGRGCPSQGRLANSSKRRPCERNSGLLGGDEVVDTLAQVLKHEILLGRRFAFVDLLGPLLERQLDAESLVDREGDVEESQRVDAEVFDGVALGRDLLARNIAGLRNDTGDRLE